MRPALSGRVSQLKLEWDHWRVRSSAGPRNQRNHELTGRLGKATNPHKRKPLGSRSDRLPFFFLEHHADDLAVRLSLNIRHGSSVDVHRGRDARVAHQLLLTLRGAPVASNHTRYVCRNACQPIFDPIRQQSLPSSEAFSESPPDDRACPSEGSQTTSQFPL